MMHLHPFLWVQKTAEKGWGVFALHDIEANTLLEISPVIVLNEKDTALIHASRLHDYYFTWGENQDQSALALGYISLYNHAEDNNCNHECHFDTGTIHIYSKRHIAANEELCIHYMMHEDKPLWFQVK